ncbi:MAG: NAD(P)-binding domain-containing protein [Muribaculaceae bacterium]|nr:NAD(P)-binding domain-containing protein [Muribaculaceae bacterium]
MMKDGRIAVIGGGSWATAIAKLLLGNCERISWFIRRPERIEEFKRKGHNPVYLSDIRFDTERIDFFSDISDACCDADTIVVAVPSPFFLETAAGIQCDISEKNVVSAVKGMVPGKNMTISEFFAGKFGCHKDNLLVIGGPCHAEEVALERLSYLTIGCRNVDKSREFAGLMSGGSLRTIVSDDVAGIEYAAVLKNVYAIAGGIVSGMKAGDNFMAMLACNAAREMRLFIDAVSPIKRDICLSAYLGDLLVTAYSRFSRNHNFGSMIGKGYSVTAAKMEMEMVAEGYYGTKCIYEINRDSVRVEMPILNAVYKILYKREQPQKAIQGIWDSLR